MPEITRQYNLDHKTKNKIVYTEQPEQGQPKIAASIYISKEGIPGEPDSLEITFRLPDPA